ncbi:MAG: hypothetical protein IJJ69_14370 [Oscillospiraceae bacterium]|nr:hypothetical protein [Oscillospiraceae bacterium]
MTELQIMKNAKACLELLAKGIDPLTKQPVPENDTVRKPALVKYLNYTAEILEKNISAMQIPEQPEKNASARFAVSDERKANFHAVNEDVTITNISNVINDGISPEEDGFIPTKALSEWLENQGLLEKRGLPNGSYRRIATEKAVDFGMTNLYNSKDNFKSVVYNTQAQQWIYDCIDEISEFCIQNADDYPRPKKITVPPMERIPIPEKPEIPLFCLTPEQKANLSPFAGEIKVSDMTKYLNSMIDTSQVKHLKNGIISGWLFSERLIKKAYPDSKHYIPTNEGQNIGILRRNSTRTGMEVSGYVFTPQAQQYIFDHIDDLIEFNRLEN